MQTTTTKRRSPRKRTSKTPPLPVNSFFAEALSIKGRFILSSMLFRAGLRILIKGRSLV